MLLESCNNIGCDVDDDHMEYTEDAIDNIILEFSGDWNKHESKIKCVGFFYPHSGLI